MPNDANEAPRTDVRELHPDQVIVRTHNVQYDTREGKVPFGAGPNQTEIFWPDSSVYEFKMLAVAYVQDTPVSPRREVRYPIVTFGPEVLDKFLAMEPEGPVEVLVRVPRRESVILGDLEAMDRQEPGSAAGIRIHYTDDAPETEVVVRRWTKEGWINFHSVLSILHGNLPTTP